MGGKAVATQRPAARPATVPELHAHWKLNASPGVDTEVESGEKPAECVQSDEGEETRSDP